MPAASAGPSSVLCKQRSVTSGACRFYLCFEFCHRVLRCAFKSNPDLRTFKPFLDAGAFQSPSVMGKETETESRKVRRCALRPS